jgi:hypothetical protein
MPDTTRRVSARLLSRCAPAWVGAIIPEARAACSGIGTLLARSHLSRFYEYTLIGPH